MGDTGAARTAGPWGLLWELQDLIYSWGLVVNLSGMTKKSSGRLEQLQEVESH